MSPLSATVALGLVLVVCYIALWKYRYASHQIKLSLLFGVPLVFGLASAIIHQSLILFGVAFAIPLLLLIVAFFYRLGSLSVFLVCSVLFPLCASDNIAINVISCIISVIVWAIGVLVVLGCDMRTMGLNAYTAYLSQQFTIFSSGRLPETLSNNVVTKRGITADKALNLFYACTAVFYSCVTLVTCYLFTVDKAIMILA